MNIKNTTPVPNALFDILLPHLKYAELKVLMIVVRQTYGFVNPKNNRQRKEFDRMTISQIAKKSGCSKRAVNDAISMLSQNQLIDIRDHNGNILRSPESRKGKYILYFSVTQNVRTPMEKFALKPTQKLRITKLTYLKQKENNIKTVSSPFHISNLLTNNYL